MCVVSLVPAGRGIIAVLATNKRPLHLSFRSSFVAIRDCVCVCVSHNDTVIARLRLCDSSVLSAHNSVECIKDRRKLPSTWVTQTHLLFLHIEHRHAILSYSDRSVTL